MKIYISHSGNYDYKNELYMPLKAATFLATHQLFFPHDQVNTGTNTKEIIKKSDLVIAEVSRPSTGQGIELGWADIYKVPILCMYSINSKPSGSLQFVSKEMFSFDTTDEMLQHLETKLASL